MSATTDRDGDGATSEKPFGWMPDDYRKKLRMPHDDDPLGEGHMWSGEMPDSTTEEAEQGTPTEQERPAEGS